MKIHLRPLRPEDAPLMLEWMQEPSIACFFRFDAASMTEEKCRAFIDSANREKNSRHYAIADERDEYLGTISLKDIVNGRAEYAVRTNLHSATPKTPRQTARNSSSTPRS